MTIALLSVLTALFVNVTPMRDSYVISVPLPSTGEKYSDVSISANGSVLDHTQIASNKWLVQLPSASASGKFSAILCGKGFCRPINVDWSTGGSRWWILAALFSALPVGYLLGLLIVRTFFPLLWRLYP